MSDYLLQRSYDEFGKSQLPVDLLNCSFAGTQTAAAVGGRVAAVPFACKIHSARRLPVSGATVASATYDILVYKSVAGTGTKTAIGTFTVAGTEAATTISGGTAAFSATESTVSLAAGDVVTCQMGIATVAVIGTNDYWFAVTELPS